MLSIIKKRAINLIYKGERGMEPGLSCCISPRLVPKDETVGFLNHFIPATQTKED
jgi:hypothetical protein